MVAVVVLIEVAVVVVVVITVVALIVVVVVVMLHTYAKKNASFFGCVSNGGRVGLCPCSHREGAGVSPDRTPDRLCCCDDPDPDPDPDRPYRDHRIDRVMIASPRGGLCRLSQAVVVAIGGSAQSTPCTRRVRSTRTVSGENIAAQKSMRANEFEMSWQTLTDQHLYDVVRQVTVLPF